MNDSRHAPCNGGTIFIPPLLAAAHCPMNATSASRRDDESAVAPPQPSHAEVRHFVAFSAGQGLSSVGTWMQKAGVGWLAWELTHSAAWVGTMALADVFAALIVAPLAGAVVDRHNPYRLLWLTQMLLLVQAASLWLLYATGILDIGLLLALTIIESILQGFCQPVRMIVTGTLAGPARMSQGVATNSIAMNLARITGPALAGVLMLHGQTGLVFLGNAASFLSVLAVTVYVRRWIDQAAAPSGKSIGRDIAQGFEYVVSTPAIAMVFVVAVSFSVLARPFAELFPAFAGVVFQGGPQTLSMLMSAQGAGALIGAGWMLRTRPGLDTLPRIILWSGIGIAVALLVFVATGDLRVAVPAMVVAGLFHVTCNIGMQSLAQLRAEPAMRGRVMALYGLVFRTAPSLGAFIIGQGTHWIGLSWLVGSGALAYGLFMLRLMPRLYRALGVPVAAVQTQGSAS
ncbi:MAG: MFS transporter [Rhodocyclaceae bacterium]